VQEFAQPGQVLHWQGLIETIRHGQLMARGERQVGTEEHSGRSTRNQVDEHEEHYRHDEQHHHGLYDAP
jgi:ABC-type Zn2+ transport system substrate-binding protein/surface adhesin